jgi:hypothetical protein
MASTFLDKMSAEALDALATIIEASNEEPQDSPAADENGEVSPQIQSEFWQLRSEVIGRANTKRAEARS